MFLFLFFAYACSVILVNNDFVLFGTVGLRTLIIFIEKDIGVVY